MITALDALKVLRTVVAMGVTQSEPCPDIGSTVAVDGASPYLWGDADCSDAVDTIDALKLLRHVAGLSVAQYEPCPAVDALVEVTG